MILAILLLSSLTFFSQTPEQIKDITKDYDIQYLKELSFSTKKYLDSIKINTLRIAKDNNIPLKFIDKDGNLAELQGFYDNGNPKYFVELNKKAVSSTRANFLNTGGGLGLNIDGQNMTAYVWDGGHALPTHTEFMISGNSKITLGDATTATPSDHATHVSGTIIARGANLNAKGFAPSANIKSYEWNNDVLEVTNALTEGMLVSNHSYGEYFDQVDDWKIGAYTIDARRWDNIMKNAPHYLMVLAAGNDGLDNISNSTPLRGFSNYDKLTGERTAKNNMVVANGQDFDVNTTTGIPLFNPQINTSSSQGPTDDFRVKPDITANGTSVLSSIKTNNTSYDTYDGTSMASPNIAGIILLLQQLYNQTKGNFAYSCTIKGLILHTADDGGMIGPDAIFGWGYANTKKAAEIILNDGNTTLVKEMTLSNNETKTFQVTSDGVNPLKISIAWIDPPANNINTGIENREDPVLVNDLDIRLEKNGEIFYPWKLTGVDSNDKGDNLVDNFERIDINAASGIYNLTISHKGTLVNPQNFTLIANGISSSSVGFNDNLLNNYSIYPNPTSSFLYITSVDNIEEILIYDNLGKLIIHNNFNENSKYFQKVDVSNLKNGIYLLKFKKNNIFVSEKFIINNY